MEAAGAVVIYTVPWFPGIGEEPDDQVPGEIMLLLRLIESIARELVVAMHSDYVNELERLGVDRENATFYVQFAGALGILGGYDARTGQAFRPTFERRHGPLN